MEHHKRLAILVGGGPAPGINSVIGAATIRAELEGLDVLGLRDHCREKNPGLSRWLDEIIEELSAAYRQGWPVLE